MSSTESHLSNKPKQVFFLTQQNIFDTFTQLYLHYYTFFNYTFFQFNVKFFNLQVLVA